MSHAQDVLHVAVHASQIRDQGCECVVVVVQHRGVAEDRRSHDAR